MDKSWIKWYRKTLMRAGAETVIVGEEQYVEWQEAEEKGCAKWAMAYLSSAEWAGGCLRSTRAPSSDALFEEHQAVRDCQKSIARKARCSTSADFAGDCRLEINSLGATTHGPLWNTKRTP